jgi:hypothetical protein
VYLVVLIGRANSLPFTTVMTGPSGQPRTTPRQRRPAPITAEEAGCMAAWELLLRHTAVDLRLRWEKAWTGYWLDTQPAASPSACCPRDGGYPRTGLTVWPSWEPSPPDASLVVLAGRATRVPKAAGTSSIWRSTTVTQTGVTALGVRS